MTAGAEGGIKDARRARIAPPHKQHLPERRLMRSGDGPSKNHSRFHQRADQRSGMNGQGTPLRGVAIAASDLFRRPQKVLGLVR